MEQNLLTKKKLKEKSIEYQIPFADLLEVFLQETLMFQILETDFAKWLWLKDREDFSIDGYRKEWQKPLYFVYGQDDGKEQQVLDEKWITGFTEEICAKREQHIRWSCSVEKEEPDYLVYITGEWEEMKVPLVIRISPLVYHAAKPEKQKLQSVFFEKKCAVYQHFPVETYLAEQLFSILKFLELIPSMEVYDTTFRLLKQETVDGRHIYETLSFFCEKEEVIPQEKRIEMLASYETYTYMKKRWEKYIRKQGTEDVSWETVLHRIIAFLSPVWNAMCRDEVFFGDWMPDLERYL